MNDSTDTAEYADSDGTWGYRSGYLLVKASFASPGCGPELDTFLGSFCPLGGRLNEFPASDGGFGNGTPLANTKNTAIRCSFVSERGHPRGEAVMLRHFIVAATLVCSTFVVADTVSADQRAFGQTWGGSASTRDWDRFYHYPYVYYPQNFWGQEYYRSSDSMYYRYPPEMRIPVYNQRWHNFYPSHRRFHKGHHFITDVF